MKIFTSRLLAALSVLSVSLVALPAFATSGSITGTVTFLKAQEPGDTFFELNSTVHVGICAFESGNQRTLALFPDTDHGKQMFAIVQGALLAGKTVSVALDDAFAIPGNYCKARSVSVSP